MLTFENYIEITILTSFGLKTSSVFFIQKIHFRNKRKAVRKKFGNARLCSQYFKVLHFQQWPRRMHR